MFRALIELLFTILIALLARAVFRSVLRGFGNAASQAFRDRVAQGRPGSAPGAPPTSQGGELHKDPVCGTYVAESTPFRSQIAGQSFYYCSENCREKHALVAR